MNESKRPHWTVDRKVPLALMLAIAVQTISFVAVGSWYISALDGRVTAIEFNTQGHDEKLVQLEERQYAADTMAARFDERLSSFDDYLKRFEVILNNMHDRSRRLP